MENVPSELWNTLSEMENHITDLHIVSKFLEYSLEPIEALEPDKAMNAIIASREYLDYLQGRMDETFRKVWSQTTKKKNLNRVYYTEVGEDGVVEIPQEILDSLGWEEGTEVTVEANTRDNIITIKKVDTLDFPGCGGDILTKEEEKALQKDGLKGLFQMKSPWDNAK
jgi:bifunctional DNA-binding transcriptional regulator/antitoxin component of YhaV-PrlF toxin-antitoxin module